jgi:hypothetical protein
VWSNGAVIAAAVALGFLSCDMALRSRLLAECVDQGEPSRYSVTGLGSFVPLQLPLAPMVFAIGVEHAFDVAVKGGPSAVLNGVSENPRG